VIITHPAPGQMETERYTRPTMGAWYWIGVLTGVGVALGVLAAGIVPRWVVAAVVAAVAGAAVGFAVFGWPEAVGGAAGGLTGGYGATPIVTGSLRRGGTRGGLALLGVLAALGTAALAFVPVVGFLEAVALPGLARRLRSRTPDRHAGLRTLARD
jgi:hypothetical protein